LDFLQRLLDSGESTVKDVYTAAEEEGLHEKVVREFAEVQVVLGNSKFGVVVGKLAESELEKYDWNWRKNGWKRNRSGYGKSRERLDRRGEIRNLRLIMLKKD
jgi:hypothetical protein